jgi:hypothetical protein
MFGNTDEESRSSHVRPRRARRRRITSRPRLLLPALVGLGLIALSAPAGASAETFPSSGNGMNINDGNCSSDVSQHAKSTPYPLTTQVSGLTGVVQDVNVTLNRYSHLAPLDVRMLLVGPQGQSTLLMHENGSTDEVWYITLTFDDAAAQPPPVDALLSAGTYQPSERSEGQTACQQSSAALSFPEPAPAGPYGSKLSEFAGTDPNGDWKLYVVDTYQGDWGSIGSWSLDITTTASVGHT